MDFQVGSNKYRYIYTATDMFINRATVYRCRRGLNEGTNAVLWLARAKDGRWIAREADKTSTDPVRQGKKTFMTKNPIDDITNPGDIDWMWYDKDGKWVAFDFTFKTTRVAE